MAREQIVDIIDEAAFGAIPPCADPAFDHRTCDYWEDAERGSKAARVAWLEAPSQRRPAEAARAANPFASGDEPVVNPFAPAAKGPAFNPFLAADDDPLADNPFAPAPTRPPRAGADAPRKLGLLTRGIGVFGSYAKTLVVEEEPVAYAQFGPLSAYPRAQRVRDLYPQLPEAPLPAVITCIAATAAARKQGHALRLVAAVCDDLAGRGFAAVEAYPEPGVPPDATSAASPAFWRAAGFSIAVDDERFPVVRLELA